MDLPRLELRPAEQANFELNHTFFLNLLAVPVALVLFGLWRSRDKREQAGAASGNA